MKWKLLLILVVTLIGSAAIQAQSLEECQRALGNSSKGVQALHHYPAHLNEGKCHIVEVTSISVNGNNVKIVETWTNYFGSKSTTTLKGVLTNGVVKGSWTSSYSGGSWQYDFNTDSGKWNKTSSSMGPFSDWEELEFDIRQRENLQDNFYKCK